MLCFVRIRPTFDCVNSVEDMPDRFILFDIELNNINKRSVSANGTSYNESNVKAEKDLNFASGNDTKSDAGTFPRQAQ